MFESLGNSKDGGMEMAEVLESENTTEAVAAGHVLVASSYPGHVRIQFILPHACTGSQK